MPNLKSNKYIPLLLTSFITLTVLSVYTNYVYYAVFPTLIFVFFTFILCDYTNDYNDKRYLLYVVALTLMTVSIYLLIKYSNSNISFLQWILSGKLDQYSSNYFIALFLLVNFFIASSIYYFTYVTYRPIFILLILFLPYILHIKKSSTVPTIFTAILISTYIVLIIFFESIHNNKEILFLNQEKYNKNLFSYFIIIFVFIFFITYFNDTIDFRINPIKIEDFSSVTLSNTEFSSPPADNSESDEIAFLVDAAEPIYFVRQVFGKYNGNNWESIKSEELLSVYQNWNYIFSSTNFDNLFEDIKLASFHKKNNIINKFYDISKNFGNLELIETATITPLKYKVGNLIVPSRTFNIFANNNRNIFYQNNLYEAFTHQDNPLDLTQNYTVYYYSDFTKDNLEYLKFVTQFSLDEYYDLLQNLNSTQYYQLLEYKNANSYFLEDFKNAQIYKEYSGIYETQKLKQLAYEITKNSKNDYEKAHAIQNYFHTNGYSYDLDYKPPKGKEDIEYFIFESKIGTCTHYATAMTLLARLAGLNARYVEGYVSRELNNNNQYVVKTKHAHAFTQIFLPFYGYMNFDATVPSYFEALNSDTTQNSENINSFVSKYTPTFFIIFSAIILIYFTLVFVYNVFLEEKFFRFLYFSKNTKDATLYLYARILKLAPISNKNISSNTLSNIIFKNYNYNIDDFVSTFNKLAYNDQIPDKKQKIVFYKMYIKLYKIFKSNKH